MNKEIGQRFKEARLQLKLNQTDFGAQIELKQQQVAKIENGAQSLDVKTVILLKRVYNISYDFLLSGKGDVILKEQDSVSVVGAPHKMVEDLKKENEWLKEHIRDLAHTLKVVTGAADKENTSPLKKG
ncbi:helix-turn-helix transcriptional regulator [uncultured Microscilla sp.]|uniref:helix-turn-helix domain-containing protein n=1 Tax=uncultured Microscilla sp. TaxID=432653 RepID=UPI002606C6B2|nr:helix-turn-helix transcriptional regulator [uncultured Microscilla sp.]